MTRGRGRSSANKPQQKANQKKDNYDQLARELFPEMNASLYRNSPSNYFRMRLASAALQLKPTADMLAAQNDLSYGVVRAQWKMPEEDELRVEYVALEITVLLHHAAETLFRLYLAHIDTPNCPWLEVTRLTSFHKFKAKLDSIRKTEPDRWDKTKLSTALLGGVSLLDSGLDIDQGAWDEHIEASIIFMINLADRLLSESNLYNTAKHGLAGIVESGTRMEMHFGDEKHVLNDGPSIAYPHRSEDPDSTAGDQKWRIAVDSILIDTDMLTIELICKYIDSIIAVARRRYVGHGGNVWLCNQKFVYATLLQGRLAASQLVSGFTFDLSTESTDSSGARQISGISCELKGRQVPDEVFDALESFDEETDGPVHVQLPEQERYRRVAVRDEHLLPFSPPGSQSRLANAQ